LGPVHAAAVQTILEKEEKPMPPHSDSASRTTRRSLVLSATALAGLGVGAGLLGVSDALASGGQLQEASQPVLVHLHNFSLNGPHAGLLDGRHLMTRVAFIPPGQHAVTINGKKYFDHSDAGIEAGAQRVAKHLIFHNAKFGFFDVELFTSVNVPSSVGYNPWVDKGHAALYYPGAREALRKEAVRYHMRLVGRVRQLRASVGFEAGEYNIPRNLNWYHRDNSSAKTSLTRKEVSDLGSTLLPMLSFIGPQAQLLIDQRMSDGIRSGAFTDDMLIYWHAESVRIRRQALGNNVRIMPTIWPRLFPLGGASLPNGSAALRPGFMRKFCNALLDAGAQGFVCWTPSGDRSLSSSDQQAMSRSWSEVVDVARARGFAAVT
jgi:hypothetical protein